MINPTTSKKVNAISLDKALSNAKYKAHKKFWLMLFIVLTIGIFSSVQIFAQESVGENILALGPGINDVTRTQVLTVLDNEYPEQIH